jgi:hypothetical protein
MPSAMSGTKRLTEPSNARVQDGLSQSGAGSMPVLPLSY